MELIAAAKVTAEILAAAIGDTMGAHWMPYTSHMIQGCINKAWDNTKGFATIAKKCTWISNFFNGNSNARTVIKRHWTTYKNGLLPVGSATLADNARPANGAPFAGNVLPTNGVNLPDDVRPASDVRPVNGPVLSNGTPSADGALPPIGAPPSTGASLPTGASPADGAPPTSGGPSISMP
ncbi:hypothetical protein KI688_006366 [Linnemannia hyalina]|uniref:Uncharacterized protein n=1 Tax=Linnemannia hyalina TaxID=64524 RepID=A0A9P7Y4U7_9FUNG|nr:hypothetical protein KI688_006366 [Linnemannia hyalina]